MPITKMQVHSVVISSVSTYSLIYTLDVLFILHIFKYNFIFLMLHLPSFRSLVPYNNNQHLKNDRNERLTS